MPYYMFGDRSQPEEMPGVWIALNNVIENKGGNERDIACFDSHADAQAFADKLAAQFTDRAFYVKD